jgi:hypothetical protein
VIGVGKERIWLEVGVQVEATGGCGGGAWLQWRVMCYYCIKKNRVCLYILEAKLQNIQTTANYSL